MRDCFFKKAAEVKNEEYLALLSSEITAVNKNCEESPLPPPETTSFHRS
jgi:hypothetical protein